MIDIHKLSGRLGNEMFRDAYIYSQFRDGVIPDIYLQDPKYFEKYADEIKKRYGEGIGYLPYVSIHLRRGDYVGNDFYCQLWETGFYIDAIQYFPNRKFIVFSDDQDFAKKYFEGDKFSFDDSLDEIEALNKIASCDGHIIANSSFSYWGAFLSPHRGKVVCPSEKSWYADGQIRTRVPKDWIQIEL